MSFASILALASLVLLLTWFAGGLALRLLGGLFAVLFTTAMAAGGDPIMLWGILPAAAIWLAGHAHYATRWGYYKSPLAARINKELRERSWRALDATRRRARIG